MSYHKPERVDAPEQFEHLVFRSGFDILPADQQREPPLTAISK